MTTAREISDRYTEAVNAHDAEAIAALYEDGAALSDPTGEFTGREAIIGYWRTYFDAFPDLQARDEHRYDVGDTAMNEWSVTGTHSEPLETPEGAIPATGKRTTLRGCDILTVRDGLIQSHRAYYDQMGFLAQLGLVPDGVTAS
jgi:steroid delta-isomerase-like uncharacterized protein